ncbi:hypothetical protein [Lutibacter sp.]|uniref:hypothetical protein n=1 Tax=Lutibacter sp. TaxID=1925666 RepID=UPI0025BE7557|nr:hypothetical protein [Lutibacter sp.]MCF6182713.1 hypothetical protein [Lutibacter sp.]
MKIRKTIYIFLASIVVACGGASNDDSPIIKDNFTIEVTAQKTTVNIDEAVSVILNASDVISNIKVSTDNFDTEATVLPNNTKNSTLYFKFNAIGSKTISIKSTNNTGEVAEKSVEINVVRGNAIKINSVKVVSFYNINQTWDAEYADTDVNRLADIFFILLKPEVNLTTGDFSYNNWYQSIVKQNQGDLIWDLTSENLYIDPDFSIFIGLADDDGTYNADLLMGPPSEREIKLSDYLATKPTTIKYTVPEINLDIELNVEWP